MFYLIGFGWTMGDDDYPRTTANGLIGTSLYATSLNDLTKSEDDEELAKNALRWAQFIFMFGMCSQGYTIMSGGLLERMSLWGYLAIVAVFSSLAFPTVAHAVWNTSGVLNAYRDVVSVCVRKVVCVCVCA